MIKEMAAKGTQFRNWSVVDDISYGITNASLIKTEMLRKVGGYDSDVRVLARARKLGISKGVVVLNATYYHAEGGTYLWYLKKLFRRVRLFGSLSDDELRNYFVPCNHDHSQRRNLLSSQIKYLQASVHMIEKKLDFWYWGVILIFSYFLVFIAHPFIFLRVLRRFL